MSLTFNTKTYTADSFQQNSVGYFGPAHTNTVKDDLALSRSPARATTVSSGVNRTKFKLVRTVTLTGAIQAQGELAVIIEVLDPVGTANADIDALLNDSGAWLAGADAKTHVKTTKINY